VLVHHSQQGDGSCHVVVVVVKRLCHGLSYGFVGSEMDDSYRFVFLEDFVYCLKALNINLLKGNIILFGDLLDSLEALDVGVVEVVYNHHFIALSDQLDHGVRSDVTYSSCH